MLSCPTISPSFLFSSACISSLFSVTPVYACSCSMAFSLCSSFLHSVSCSVFLSISVISPHVSSLIFSLCLFMIAHASSASSGGEGWDGWVAGHAGMAHERGLWAGRQAWPAALAPPSPTTHTPSPTTYHHLPPPAFLLCPFLPPQALPASHTHYTCGPAPSLIPPTCPLPSFLLLLAYICKIIDGAQVFKVWTGTDLLLSTAAARAGTQRRARPHHFLAGTPTYSAWLPRALPRHAAHAFAHTAAAARALMAIIVDSLIPITMRAGVCSPRLPSETAREKQHRFDVAA